MRRAARIDANQPSIVKALREKGYSVAITSALGHGFPDLVVAGGRSGQWLFEVKDPAQPTSKRALTEDEVKFMQNWLGLYAVILTADEAIALLEA